MSSTNNDGPIFMVDAYSIEGYIIYLNNTNLLGGFRFTSDIFSNSQLIYIVNGPFLGFWPSFSTMVP